MRFRQISLQNFRNLALVSAEMAGRRHFLTGANGQGKTNFLEAAGLVTALRSFRGADPRTMIAFGQPQADAAFVLEHEQLGESRLTLTLTPKGKAVAWEQTNVARLADVIGKFPTVVLSSNDNQFLRGAPSVRRRWFDLTLAAMDPEYLAALQSYHRALAERNSLLKTHGSPAELAAFEREMAGPAAILVAKRQAGAAELDGFFLAAHARLVPEGETAGLAYVPDEVIASAEQMFASLAQARSRDHLLKTTEHGPHRDDLELGLNGRPAKQYASEGQQRCLVIALRLAQSAYFKAKSGVTPVLLCDDVLGELDPVRRARFWASLDGEPQVIATGTSPPERDGSEWQVFRVAAGAITAGTKSA
ncbi:MAG: DNA replication and repair protein RecF [Opitutaceae bacterium]|nr:DNA replication and repair protein RecF [Opitutaceae bacterium]